MELKNVVPWGRTLDEYREMFSLSDGDCSKSILGCSDGPASFNAEMRQQGKAVISIDPVYQFDAKPLQTRINEVYGEIVAQMHAHKDKYVWKNIADVDELGEVRMAAMRNFLEDYEKGKEEGRYLFEQLPQLSFSDNQFDLALCSHFLFLYSDHFDIDMHIASVRELCRVAKEVRIYPLLTLQGELSPYVQAVRDTVEADGLISSLVDVTYEFQKGATQMLVIR